jgi:hypothetical protein
MSWSNRLLRPVIAADRQKIVTLSDARACALAPHVQVGIAVLLRAADSEVDEFTAQSAVAHIVHGPPKPLARGRPDRPWMKREATPRKKSLTISNVGSPRSCISGTHARDFNKRPS